MNGLLDTSIVVDLLRQYLPADQWLSTQATLGITRIVWLEVIHGSATKASQENAIKLLRRFEPVELTPSDIIWATDQLTRLNLSFDIDPFDYLIASASYRLQIPLFTKNVKHFQPLIGKLAVAPY